MAMQLLGIGEGALDGFLAALVNGLAPRRQAVGITISRAVCSGAGFFNMTK